MTDHAQHPDTPEAFSWLLDETLWPPGTMPTTPLSMTHVEIARSCPLRLVFERTARSDRRYVRRLAFSGRVGTAIHRSIDRLANAGYTGQYANPEAMTTIRQVWMEEIELQRQQARDCPRDAGRPEPEARIASGPSGILSTLRMMPEGDPPHGPPGPLATTQHAGLTRTPEASALPRGWERVVEHPVRSNDGLFAGILDRVERLPRGVRIVDTKSTTRPEVPDRYRRQLQLYAAMWNETHPERSNKAAEAVLSYPLLGTQHPVSIKEADVAATVDEAKDAATLATQATQDHASLARPGATCGICCWRPWCRPFQEWIQANGKAVDIQSRSKFGLRGTLRQRLVQGDVLVLEVEWGGGNICRLIVPPHILPHLWNIEPGTELLVLDTPLTGQIKHARATADGESEVFILQ